MSVVNFEYKDDTCMCTYDNDEFDDDIHDALFIVFIGTYFDRAIWNGAAACAKHLKAVMNQERKLVNVCSSK